MTQDQLSSDLSNCRGCPEADKCRQVWSAARRGPFNAVGLSLASALVFLLPLTTAIAAGALMRVYRPSEQAVSVGEIIAVVGGLLIGLAIAWLLVPVVRKHFHE